tara:strand:+ start:1577 stop:1849 length:273 start_codon:yes stop_codon:yes gene_type:complete
MEELLKDYGLPTALLMGISAWCAYLVNFLKGLITSDIATLNEAVQNLSKDIRNTQDDITRIELMIRLMHDIKKDGQLGPEMSKIGKNMER